MAERKCTACGKVKPLSAFGRWASKGLTSKGVPRKPSPTHKCSECILWARGPIKSRASLLLKQRTQRTEYRALGFEICGSACLLCGYDRFAPALNFHHVDPDDKEYSLSVIAAKSNMRAEYIREAFKCVTLCARCHREVHGGYSTVPMIQLFED